MFLPISRNRKNNTSSLRVQDLLAHLYFQVTDNANVPSDGVQYTLEITSMTQRRNYLGGLLDAYATLNFIYTQTYLILLNIIGEMSSKGNTKVR